MFNLFLVTCRKQIALKHNDQSKPSWQNCHSDIRHAINGHLSFLWVSHTQLIMTAASNKKKKKKQSFSCLPSWHVHLSWSAFWTPNPSSCKPVRGGNPFSFSQPCATFTEQLGSFFWGFFCFWIFRGSHLERISKNKKQKLCQTVQAEDLFTDLFSHSSAVAKADVKTKLHPFRSTTGSKASTIYLRVPAATAPSRGRIFCLQRTCE